MNKSLLIIAVGIGVGYVIGARAGRQRYDLIVDRVSGVWEDPRVANARREAARYARVQAPVLLDKAQALVQVAPGVVAGVVTDGAKATAAVAKDVADRTAAAAKDVANRAVSTTRSVADRTGAGATSAAAAAATRVGEARDAVLVDDYDDGEQEQRP